MDVKRFFGALLTLVGILCFIHAGNVYLTAKENDIKILISNWSIGIVFLVPGVSLVRKRKNKPEE